MVVLDNVTVRYGPTTALADFSSRIDGGAVGLLGPNGAGKSTLIKSLLGFVRPVSGRVEVFGHRLPEEYLAVRRGLGYMPEREVLAPRASPVAFLTTLARLSGLARPDALERAHASLTYAGVGEARYRPMETASTGNLQRVKFAAALVHDPKLLLLDEPTNGLDPDGRQEMLELIRDLPRRRDVAVLLSSHLLPDVEAVCDRVLLLGRGRLLREGRVKELTGVKEGLFEVQVWDQHAAFANALEQARCRLLDTQQDRWTVSAPPGVEPRMFFDIARRQGTHVRTLRPLRRRLEETFLEALGAAPADEV